MYTDNEAMYKSEKVALALNYAKVVDMNSEENFIVSLDTAYGIANFKKLMEIVMLPYLQESTKASGVLVDSLKVETRANVFGIRGNVITSTFPLGQLSNPINAEKFKKLVTEFNNLDVVSGIPKIESAKQGAGALK
jgi:hypothetical protein